MNRVHILDCTLRDGGYCNQWEFGFDNTRKIVSGLIEANIDIIECGFLTERITYNKECTKFVSIEDMASVIPKDRKGKIIVAMVNYGEYEPENLPEYDGSSIDGIRVAFHKRDLKAALQVCKKIKDKGYKVFVQAMVSLSYSDEEFLDMIQKVNEMEPYAFYIVDSFGMMKGKDLTRLFYMVEHNLNEKIWIGFHSHNNMQLAYSNAQTLVSIHTKRNIVIDSSVYGMGRGAGNLNTELFVEYLNENMGTNYELKPLLVIIDEILNDFYQRNYWGYSLPNYLSASHHAHPEYAGYLDDKKTLTVENISEIFDMMDDERKLSFDKKYIEDLYLRYMKAGTVRDERNIAFKEKIKDKKVLLIAPGKSSSEEKNIIIDFIQSKEVITISVNFCYPYADVDYIFLSNLRRFKELNIKNREKAIVTSNISADDICFCVKYQELLNEEELVKDNAGMMAIKFLILNGVQEIYLAGFDGYSHDVKENYGERQMEIITRNTVLDAMNVGMGKIIKEYSQKATIKFLTEPKHVRI